MDFFQSFFQEAGGFHLETGVVGDFNAVSSCFHFFVQVCHTIGFFCKIGPDTAILDSLVGVAACHYGNVQQFSQFSGFLFSGCPVCGNVFAVEIQKVQTSQLFQRQLGNVASFPERVACAYDHMILIKKIPKFLKREEGIFFLVGLQAFI